MIKKAFGWLLETIAGSLEHELDPRRIRAYIERKYSHLIKWDNHGEAVEKDLADLEKVMVELGWLKQGGKVKRNDKKTSVPAGMAWFGKQGLEPGAGQALDQLDSQGADQEAVEIMEKILRHVEVRRENSLCKFTNPLTPGQIWLERLDICILFSRTARRRSDLRFLNAALKMNEWYFRQIRTSPSIEITTRYLLALAEQELSAKELLIC